VLRPARASWIAGVDGQVSVAAPRAPIVKVFASFFKKKRFLALDGVRLNGAWYNTKRF
jgi:hypothetical protein